MPYFGTRGHIWFGSLFLSLPSLSSYLSILLLSFLFPISQNGNFLAVFFTDPVREL